ncbi:MAG: trans-aconitate 2-methyltransferase [Pseudomonadota bacterium]|nr:trans-aconitate 2-methyltransferase [Pseudomonadota bacterium]
MDWSARQYLRFEDERTRPARDLLNAIGTQSPARVIDLGCGPGNSTELLAQRFPQAEVEGLDSSPDMVKQAHARLPGIRFQTADLNRWTPDTPYDVIFSNAVLHWLPDHESLLPRLMKQLSPGGSIAFQMPDNLDEPSHSSMRDVAALARFKAKLGSADGERTAIGTPDDYYRILKPLGARVDIWRTVYTHVLDGAEAIVEWFKGSGLRPYLARLDEGERAEYLAAYLDRIREAYPPQPDGKVLLAFPRLFVVAGR